MVRRGHAGEVRGRVPLVGIWPWWVLMAGDRWRVAGEVVVAGRGGRGWRDIQVKQEAGEARARCAACAVSVHTAALFARPLLEFPR